MTELETMQKVQAQLGKLQYQYPSERIEFWALALAWEAVRLAWYVVYGDLDTAREKLARAKDALADCEKRLTKHRAEAHD